MNHPALIAQINLIRTPISIVLVRTLCLIFIFAIGCSTPTPWPKYEPVPDKFKPRAEAETLMPKAQEAVANAIKERFGIATEMKAPLFLPIEQGGIRGVVKSFQGDSKTTTLVVSFKENGEKIKSGQVFAQLFDEPIPPPDPDDEGENPPPLTPVLHVVSYDQITGTLILDHPIPTKDLKGASFFINPGEKLVLGQQLYKAYCMNCHGFTGDGKGRIAENMTPRPRDFRLGKFKYTSTAASERASTKDLHRMIIDGIPGTYMPSFKVMAKSQRDAIVAYIKYLAMRGELEQRLCLEIGLEFSQKSIQKQLKKAKTKDAKKEVQDAITEDWNDFLKEDLPFSVFENLVSIQEDWERADEESSILYPTAARPDLNGSSFVNKSKTSIENGRILFHSKKAQCVSCHGKSGKGDGVQTLVFHKNSKDKKYKIPGLHDDWGNLAQPRDLTKGVFGGGQRPIDIFRRIHSGIKGTQMVPFGGTGLKDTEIWDIVNYLIAMPNFENNK